MSGQHIVIVTGGRSYPESLRPVVCGNLADQYALYGPFILIHGACKRRDSNEMCGADRYADDWAQHAPGIDLRRRPADWASYGNHAGPIRNEAMVWEALSLAPPERITGLAFPEPHSTGTWNCVGHMQNAGIDVKIWRIDEARQWLADRRGTR